VSINSGEAPGNVEWAGGVSVFFCLIISNVPSLNSFLNLEACKQGLHSCLLPFNQLNRLDPENQDSSIFRGAPPDYRVKSSERVFREGLLSRASA